MPDKKTRVLIIDDSPTVREILKQIFTEAEETEVVGMAENPLVARDLIKRHSPDVLTLDIEMPEMDGISFLRNLMRLRPTPVVMCSSLTRKNSEASIKALQIGAVDYIHKPEDLNSLTVYANLLVQKVVMASKANLQTMTTVGLSVDEVIKKTRQCVAQSGSAALNKQLIAIGASTGGVEALSFLLPQFPVEVPPIVISQHIPKEFSLSFATRVNEISKITVHEASDGQVLEPGAAYIAPGGQHLLLKKDTRGNLIVSLSEGDLVNGHRPSVDAMFESVTKISGRKIIAAILTGMGADGAKCLKLLRDQGAYTIAQDEASSVVWGMPGSAVKLNAACTEVSLNKMVSVILTEVIKNMKVYP